MSISERVADDMVWHTDFMSVQLGLSLMGSYVKINCIDEPEQMQTKCFCCIVMCFLCAEQNTV